MNSSILSLLPFSASTESPSSVGVFNVIYNVTVAGNYTINVTDTTTSLPILGSPFNLKVEPGPTFGPASQLLSGNAPQEMIFQAVDSW